MCHNLLSPCGNSAAITATKITITVTTFIESNNIIGINIYFISTLTLTTGNTNEGNIIIVKNSDLRHYWN